MKFITKNNSTISLDPKGVVHLGNKIYKSVRVVFAKPGADSMQNLETIPKPEIGSDLYMFKKGDNSPSFKDEITQIIEN